MGTTKERTQKEIIDYIRTHSKDGKLTQSLLDIAHHIGYSNATIHRTLKALEEKGLVEITPSEKPTEPNTIVYKGDMDPMSDFLAKGAQLSEQIRKMANDLEAFVSEANWMIRKAEEQKGLPVESIVSVTDVPNTDLQVITVRKEIQ